MDKVQVRIVNEGLTSIEIPVSMGKSFRSSLGISDPNPVHGKSGQLPSTNLSCLTYNFTLPTSQLYILYLPMVL